MCLFAKVSLCVSVLFVCAYSFYVCVEREKGNHTEMLQLHWHN